MVYATKYMSYRERSHYLQTNNAYEALLGEYETCGPTSFMSCLNSVGYETGLIDGVQEEDIATSFFNNPRNFEEFQKVRKLNYFETPPNRVPQLYPLMARKLFGAEAKFFMGNVRNNAIEALKRFRAVHLCFDRRPGHYVAVVGYDEGNHEVIYNDPLVGFNLRIGDNLLEAFRNWGNIVYPPSKEMRYGPRKTFA